MALGAWGIELRTPGAQHDFGRVAKECQGVGGALFLLLQGRG